MNLQMLSRIACMLIIGLAMIFQPLDLSAQRPYPYADLHVNTALKPYNSRLINSNRYSLWEEIIHDCGETIADDVRNTNSVRQSQSHFEALLQGNVRLACMALSPIETQMFFSRSINDKNRKATVSCMTGIYASERVLRQNQSDYFEDLINHINYVQQFQEEIHRYRGNSASFSLIRESGELESQLNDPNKLNIVLAIEGGHALGHSIYIDDNLTDTEEYEDIVLTNLDRLKGLRPLVPNSEERIAFPILYMSLASNFGNGLVGQAQSFTKEEEEIFGIDADLNKGVSPLGKKVIKKMLDQERGKRILVDVRHMSLQSRQWYYDYVHELRDKGIRIPIVVSHCGISGLSWSSGAYKDKDDSKKNKTSYLNHWTQNLSADDIIAIGKSQGLIGISMNMSELAGYKAFLELQSTVPGSAQRRKSAVKIIMANMLKVVEVIGSANAWDRLCIGSDFDAMMVPFEMYVTARDIPDLANDIEGFLKDPEKISGMFTVEDINKLRFGLTPEQITRKVMSENVLRFITENLDVGKLP